MDTSHAFAISRIVAIFNPRISSSIWNFNFIIILPDAFVSTFLSCKTSYGADPLCRLSLYAPRGTCLTQLNRTLSCGFRHKNHTRPSHDDRTCMVFSWLSGIFSMFSTASTSKSPYFSSIRVRDSISAIVHHGSQRPRPL